MWQEECRQLLAEETQRTRDLEAQIAATEVSGPVSLLRAAARLHHCLRPLMHDWLMGYC